MARIDTSVYLNNEFILQNGNTVNHYHGDPKLIEQDGCQASLLIGDFVYLDSDGIYKKAIANSRKSSNVQGIVWSFVGDNKFYLKHNHGHMFYRHPLPKYWFNLDIDGNVDEKSPLYSYIPSLLGNPLYLSDITPGRMTTNPPSTYIFMLGYRTEYGFYYKPEPQCSDYWI